MSYNDYEPVAPNALSKSTFKTLLGGLAKATGDPAIKALSLDPENAIRVATPVILPKDTKVESAVEQKSDSEDPDLYEDDDFTKESFPKIGDSGSFPTIVNPTLDVEYREHIKLLSETRILGDYPLPAQYGPKGHSRDADPKEVLVALTKKLLILQGRTDQSVIERAQARLEDAVRRMETDLEKSARTLANHMEAHRSALKDAEKKKDEDTLAKAITAVRQYCFAKVWQQSSPEVKRKEILEKAIANQKIYLPDEVVATAITKAVAAMAPLRDQAMVELEQRVAAILPKL